eukprot:1136505-Pelagomonas_calceolata.AAC.2
MAKIGELKYAFPFPCWKTELHKAWHKHPPLARPDGSVHTANITYLIAAGPRVNGAGSGVALATSSTHAALNKARHKVM